MCIISVPARGQSGGAEFRVTIAPLVLAPAAAVVVVVVAAVVVVLVVVVVVLLIWWIVDLVDLLGA